MSFKLRPPAELVRNAVSTCSSPERAKSLINTVPGLNDLCVNLAKLLCDVVPVRNGQKPLLDACIGNGFERYRSMEGKGGDIKACVTAFAQGLFERLDEANDVRVYVQIGNTPVPWKPSPETLHEFLSRYPDAIPRVAHEKYASVDAHTIRQVFAARVIDLAQVNALGGSLDNIVRQVSHA